MKTITELTIVRSKWLRGEGSWNTNLDRPASYLLRSSDNKMCCLGFACIAMGCSEDDIRGVTAPFSLRRFNLCPKQLDWPVANTINELMQINDSIHNSDEQREKEITNLFLNFNPPIKVTFVD